VCGLEYIPFSGLTPQPCSSHQYDILVPVFVDVCLVVPELCRTVF